MFVHADEEVKVEEKSAVKQKAPVVKVKKEKLRGKRLVDKYKAQAQLFLMIVPMMVITFIFCYWPLRGWQMAFYNYKPAKGYKGSKYVGFGKFEMLFKDKIFWQDMVNTLAMSLMILVFGTLITITFALLLNEIRSLGFKKFVQLFSYLPHFLSWVIVCSLVADILSSSNGTLNNLLISIHIIDKPVLWLGKPEYFWWINLFSNVWKETGWNAIIYIAAMAGIDQALYEAAEIDGAGRFRKMWHVTLPGIKSTMIVILIMNLGWILNGGFELPYLLGKGLVLDRAETIDLFVLKYGITNGDYSLATAAGIFKSVISIILVTSTNWVSNKLGESSLM